jgi:hypothetical protein
MHADVGPRKQKPDASAIANTDIKGVHPKVRNSKTRTNQEIVKTPGAMARDFQNSENMQIS